MKLEFFSHTKSTITVIYTSGQVLLELSHKLNVSLNYNSDASNYIIFVAPVKMAKPG